MLAGYYLPAAVLARAAMEGRLKQWYRFYVCMTVPRRSGLVNLIGQLYQRRHLDRAAKKQLKRAAAIGNRAAHNRPVAWHEVCELIDVVHAFLVSHPDPAVELAERERRRSEADDTDSPEWEGGAA